MKKRRSVTTVDHKSVLTEQVLQFLLAGDGSLYIDATLGGGGHTRAILQREKKSRVIGIDWDKHSLEATGAKLAHEFNDRFIPLWGNFAHLYRLAKKEKITAVNGICADFGTSQFQINQYDGFSFNQESSLDMRMSPAHQTLQAGDIVNRYTEKDLARLFFRFGEESSARLIARAIVQERATHRIETTKQLSDLVKAVLHRHELKKRDGLQKSPKIHPATKVFQALRICVNNELENIKLFLPIATSLLQKEGRLVCISFHSLEDRLVKRFFADHPALLTNLTRKPLEADDEEKKMNRSSRSAKLRAAEKI